MQNVPFRSTALAAFLLAALLAFPTRARAQDSVEEGFDAHGFHLAAFDGDIRDPYSVLRAGRLHQMEWFVGGLFEYAEAPLSYVSGTAGNETVEPVLDNIFALNLSSGIAPHERVRVDLALPLFLASTGYEGVSQGVGLGDMRLSGMVSILRPEEPQGTEGSLGVGVVPWLDLPAGDDQAFLGNRAVSGGLAGAATYELEKLTFSGHLGLQFNPAVELENLKGSDTLLAGLSAGYLIDPTMATNLELLFAPPFQKAEEQGTASASQLLLSFRKRMESGAHFSLGLGTALSQGAGASPFRLLLGGGFGQIGEPLPKDLDGDGIVNRLDACPEKPETVNGWDEEDGCPDSLGTVVIKTRYQGEERTGASIEGTGPDGEFAFTRDQMPVLEEVMPGTQVKAEANYGGCLTGTGSIEVAEGSNELPIDLERTRTGRLRYEVFTSKNKSPIDRAEVRVISEYPECGPGQSPITLDETGIGQQDVGAGEHVVVIGAPDFGLFRAEVTVEPQSETVIRAGLKSSKVRLEKKKIVILEKVYFETAKAAIKPQSFELLDEVASVIIAHPEIEQVEVAGHTDSRGAEDYNQELSEARAQSVVEYLTSQGVLAERLIAKGYGESNPIASNRSRSGRARNRRVEFNILSSQNEDPPAESE